MAGTRIMTANDEMRYLHMPRGITELAQTFQVASQKNMVVGDYVRIYVDSTNGNDTTGDGTQAKPFKKLETALSLLNNNFNSEYRIYLASGDYYFPEDVFSISNVALHLVTNEENTNIYIQSTQALAWYNCHLRISPDITHLNDLKSQTYEQLTATYNKFAKVYITNGMYFDGGYCLLDYVYLYNKNGNVTMNGGYFEAFRCFFGSHLIVRAGTLKLDGSHFSYNNQWYTGHNSFINAQNSNVQIKPYKTDHLYGDTWQEGGTTHTATSNDYRTIFNGGGKNLNDGTYPLSAINCAFNSQLCSLYQVHMTNYTMVMGDREANNVSMTCGIVTGRYRGLGATADRDITLSHTLTSISTN